MAPEIRLHRLGLADDSPDARLTSAGLELYQTRVGFDPSPVETNHAIRYLTKVPWAL
jgi:hypothetical protein